MSKIKVCFVMDPIERIHVEKDTTFAMMLEAQRRGWQVDYTKIEEIFLELDQVKVMTSTLHLYDDRSKWFDVISEKRTCLLKDYDLVLMRKDPPFNMRYIYATYLLERAERDGAKIFNRPASLRDCNEKCFVSWFPECSPATLISSDEAVIKGFVKEHGHCVLKPLDSMGGHQIFSVKADDINLTVMIETLTQAGSIPIMAQAFIPAVHEGDKRILVINGQPFRYALNRIPQPGELRGNLAAGARGEVVKITERDEWICQQIAPTLCEKGLLFVGIDIIGGYLTEINVTSPTCAREIQRAFNTDPCAVFFDVLSALTGESS